MSHECSAPRLRSSRACVAQLTFWKQWDAVGRRFGLAFGLLIHNDDIDGGGGGGGGVRLACRYRFPQWSTVLRGLLASLDAAGVNGAFDLVAHSYGTVVANRLLRHLCHEHDKARAANAADAAAPDTQLDDPGRMQHRSILLRAYDSMPVQGPAMDGGECGEAEEKKQEVRIDRQRCCCQSHCTPRLAARVPQCCSLVLNYCTISITA